VCLCSVDTDVAAEETIVETPPLNNNARFKRMKWIAGTFYLIVMILWLADWLGPQCCDMQNNYKWSFEFGLRYINGPPPTWFSWHGNCTSLSPAQLFFYFCVLYKYTYIYIYFVRYLSHCHSQIRGWRFDDISFEGLP